MNRAIIALSAAVLVASPAAATTVELVKGKVLINKGSGFRPTTSGTQAGVGDQLLANAGGSATLVYPDGCQVRIVPGTVVSVGKQPPCTAPSLVGGEDERWYVRNPLVPFTITAGIGWGIFCAAVYCRDDGGGRAASP
jgi:hypothetical protein